MIVMNRQLFLSLLISIISFSLCAQTLPSDKQATQETVNLYLNLQKLVKKGILVGHQDDLYRGKGWRAVPGRSDIKELVGEFPAILGSDMGKVELKSKVNFAWQRFDDLTWQVQQFYRQGGINTMSWHMNNPVDPSQGVKSVQDSTIYYLFSNPELLKRYDTWIDAAADYLLSLKGDAGEPIPILLRLFHEHNGNWFWWGKSHCTAEEYVKMWRYTVDYLRKKRNVHNLLIVYCPDVFTSREEYLERYPGDDYVDVLGFDLYDKENWHPSGTYIQKGRIMVDILKEINGEKKKIMAMAETGLNKITVDNWWTGTLLQVLKDSGLSYALIWSMGQNNYWSPYKGHPSAPDFEKLYKTKWMLFESDIRKYSIYQSEKPIKTPRTVYMIGDSTMANKDGEKYPETGWGQAFAGLFNESVKVENRALDGRSSRSFIEEGRWTPIYNELRRGDYVIIQFGHNDEKVDTPRGTTIYDYKQNLKRYIDETREKGATPILLTPVTRRTFSEKGKIIDSHGAYSKAAREVAEEEKVCFIDAHRISERIISGLGEKASKELYLWIEPGQYAYYPDGKKDNTHFTEKGARTIAEAIATEIRQLDLPLRNWFK